jgi:hypothetical protein
MILTGLLALASLSELILAPQSLSREQATMLEVSATHTKVKKTKRESAYLEPAAGEGFSVPCEKVEALCAELRRGKIAKLTVWRVDPGNFGGTWLAAAENNGSAVLTVDEQNRMYRASHRVMWIVLAFAMAACAFCAMRVRKRA